MALDCKFAYLRGDQLVLAIDPGASRWGLAVVSADGECAARRVVPSADGPAAVAEFLREYSVRAVVLGDRTGASSALASLRAFGLHHNVELVPEHGSTLEARRLYFQCNPPRGIWKLLPRGLLTPPVPIDDYAAWVLALRYLGCLPKESPY
ncbi:MAG: pre-16S rRNA-processing nuclease YqgF [Armatimonadota bacterium]